MQGGSECVTVSLIRPKFKTGNHLIVACGRLVSGPTGWPLHNTAKLRPCQHKHTLGFRKTQQAKFDITKQRIIQTIL